MVGYEQQLAACWEEQLRAAKDWSYTRDRGAALGVADWTMEEVEIMQESVSPSMETNPKDLIGRNKVSLSRVPPVALAHCASAMMDGAAKYGPYNWRQRHVQASIYIDSAIRHLLAWFDGEEQSEDAHVHHLGHAMACCAILMDAQEVGCMRDDRPQMGGGYNRVAKSIATKGQHK